MLIERGLYITSTAQASITALHDPELLELGQQAGLLNVYVGIESTDPEVLKGYNKKQTPEQIQRAVDTVKEYSDITIHGMFMIGSDFHTLEKMERDLEWALLNVDTAQFSVEIPLPGTNLYFQRKAEGRILTEDWSLYDGHHPVTSPKHMAPEDVLEFQIRAFTEFYKLSVANLKKNLWLRKGPLIRNTLREYSTLIKNFGKVLKRDDCLSLVLSNWKQLLKPLLGNNLGRHYIARRLVQAWKTSDRTIEHLQRLPFLSSLNQRVNSEIATMFELLPDLRQRFNGNIAGLVQFYESSMAALLEEVKRLIGSDKGLDYYLDQIAQNEQEILRLIYRPTTNPA
jgi:hypothetical protein